MKPNAAEVRPADSLDVIADRVKAREKKSRKDQLEHAKRQAADVLAARQQSKRGQWGPWCEKAGLSQQRAWQYVEFGKSLAASDFFDMTEDQQWAEWQRISGHTPPSDNPVHSNRLRSWLEQVDAVPTQIDTPPEGGGLGGIKTILAEREKWDEEMVVDYLLPKIRHLRDTLNTYEKEISDAFEEGDA